MTQATTLLESTRAIDPAARDQPAPGAKRAEHAARADRRARSTRCCAGPQGIPAAPAQVAVSVPAEMLRRRPDIRSAELMPPRSARASASPRPSSIRASRCSARSGCEATGGGSGASACSIRQPLLRRRPADLLALLQLRPHSRTACASRTRAFSSCSSATGTPCSRPRRRWRTRWSASSRRRRPRLSQQNAVTAARRSVELAFVQYREGAVDYQRVLDAQRSLLAGAEQAGPDALRRSRTNLIALYKALGGGWELRQGQPVVPDSTRNEMKERTNWGDLLRAAPTGNGVRQSSSQRLRETLPWPRRSRTTWIGSSRSSSSSSAAFFGFQYWKAKQDALPEGIVVGQRPDRGQARRRRPPRSRCRVKEVLVDEGDLVKPGQVLVRLDTVTLEAELAEARASVAAAQGGRGGRPRRPSSSRRARSSSPRSRPTAPQNARRGERDVAARVRRPQDDARDDDRPALARGAGEAAGRQAAGRGRRRPTWRRSRRASTTRRSSRRSPAGCSIAWPSRARCSAAGGKALTLVNLEDVYMEIFLPSDAGRRA